jgi:hypothetical protein
MREPLGTSIFAIGTISRVFLMMIGLSLFYRDEAMIRLIII